MNRDIFNPESEDYNPLEHELYKKGWEIQTVVYKIVDLIPDDMDEMGKEAAREMNYYAGIMCAKIAGAQGDMPYSIKMENATFIRHAAHNLIIQEHMLRHFDFDEKDYFQLIRDLVEEYRQIFVQWVEGFDPWNYVAIDRWGLFNPPGVGANDHDPDDDIPHNPDDDPFGLD